MTDKHVLVEAIEWLYQLEPFLNEEYPPELPPESDPRFCWTAIRLEMQHRKQQSEDILQMLAGARPQSMTPLEGWLLYQRIRWGCEHLKVLAMKGVTPTCTPLELLAHVLIRRWEEIGCLELWKAGEEGDQAGPASG